MNGPYYADKLPYRSKWYVMKRSRGGDRQLATGMSEKTARKVARLLNEDYAHHTNAPLHPVDEVHG